MASYGWWLRSPSKFFEIRAGFVYGSYGFISSSNVYVDGVGVSPAFNIHLSSSHLKSLANPVRIS